MNYIIFDTIKTIVIDSHFLPTLWLKHINNVVYLININSIRSNKGISLLQKYKSKVINLKHLKVFRYIAYYYMCKKIKIKIKSNIILYMMVEYNIISKFYRLYNFTRCKMFVIKHVKFNKSKRAIIKNANIILIPLETTIIFL